jgi:cytochrome c oxidase cbb3-type subunit III
MRPRRRSISAFPRFALALLALTPAICRAQPATNPFAGNARAVEEGRKSFVISCAPCHGATGEGAQGQVEGLRPADLTTGTFKGGNRDADLFRAISKGVEGGGMPSFEPLGTDQIWRLVTFIRTLSRSESSAAGNAAAGEALFWGKGNCGRCHAVGTRGNNLGPDLAHGGRRVTPQRLKRSIVAPEEEIAAGYEIVTIVTRDGKTVSGLARFYDDFSARLIDSSGNERTYLRAEVVSMTREMRSLMPGDYAKVFSGPELDDLVAYIMKLRSEASRQ